MPHRYLDDAVDDFAAGWREEVRPFLAQRVNEKQAPAVFGVLGSIRENGRVSIAVVYLDEQFLNEMTHGQPDHAGVFGVPVC